MSGRLALLLAALAGAFLGSPANAGGQEVRNTSYQAPDGSRVLQQSVVVTASLRDAWDAFTTSEGVRSWAAPVAFVDFRLGGVWESSYRAGAQQGDPANIRNRFLSYLPLRMITIQADGAPPELEFRELLGEVFTVFELDEIEPGRVRVTASMVGYRDDPAHERMYRFFEAGNEWSLRQLERSFQARSSSP